MAQEIATREEYRSVGKPVRRIDAAGKVTGKTVYADDMKLPRMLHAKVLGSAYAHARIKSINADRARSHPGVAAVITAGDLPDYRKNPSNRHDIIFAEDEALFYGQPLAAVLAEDPHTAEEALALIDLESEELPAVLDPIAAMAEDSPLARSPISDVDRSEEKGHIAAGGGQGGGGGKPRNIASP